MTTHRPRARLHRCALAALGLCTAVLIADCGPSASLPTAPFRPLASTACHATPPDVVADISTAETSPGTAPSSDAERAAERRYEYAHWDLIGVPVGGGPYTWEGFTSDAQAGLAEIRRSVPEPSLVRAYCAPFSRRTLDQVQKEVVADAAQLHRWGILVSQVSADNYEGLVDVGVIHLNSDTADRLRARYGASIGRVYDNTVDGCDESGCHTARALG